MRLCANAAVVRAWNDMRQFVDSVKGKSVCIIQLGSKFIKTAKLFMKIFPKQSFPDLSFCPERNDV